MGPHQQADCKMDFGQTFVQALDIYVVCLKPGLSKNNQSLEMTLRMMRAAEAPWPNEGHGYQVSFNIYNTLMKSSLNSTITALVPPACLSERKRKFKRCYKRLGQILPFFGSVQGRKYGVFCTQNKTLNTIRTDC